MDRYSLEWRQHQLAVRKQRGTVRVEKTRNSSAITEIGRMMGQC